MPFQPGEELLHYRFVEQIGEGGMGVVWKAVDTTLVTPFTAKSTAPDIDVIVDWADTLRK